jgi:hypothetical protein
MSSPMPGVVKMCCMHANAPQKNSETRKLRRKAFSQALESQTFFFFLTEIFSSSFTSYLYSNIYYLTTIS